MRSLKLFGKYCQCHHHLHCCYCVFVSLHCCYLCSLIISTANWLFGEIFILLPCCWQLTVVFCQCCCHLHVAACQCRHRAAGRLLPLVIFSLRQFAVPVRVIKCALHGNSFCQHYYHCSWHCSRCLCGTCCSWWYCWLPLVCDCESWSHLPRIVIPHFLQPLSHSAPNNATNSTSKFSSTSSNTATQPTPPWLWCLCFLQHIPGLWYLHFPWRQH